MTIHVESAVVGVESATIITGRSIENSRRLSLFIVRDDMSIRLHMHIHAHTAVARVYGREEQRSLIAHYDVPNFLSLSFSDRIAAGKLVIRKPFLFSRAPSYSLLLTYSLSLSPFPFSPSAPNKCDM